VIPWYLKLLGVGALIAALVGWGWVGGKASERNVWKVKEAKMIQSAFDMSERARLKEQADRERITKAEQNGLDEKAKAERDAALLRADADRVRSEFAAYIRGPANDSISACVARGEATGLVLSEAISVAGAMAEAGEVCEADKRTLIAAWPKP